MDLSSANLFCCSDTVANPNIVLGFATVYEPQNQSVPPEKVTCVRMCVQVRLDGIRLV